jgi:hypothetical protein
MFQPTKGHCHAVGTVAHMHTSNTSVHIQCKVIYHGTDVRDISFMLLEVQMCKVYADSYSLAKSMMTGFPWLYKFSSMPCGYVCVQTCVAWKLLYMYVCPCFVCSMVYMQSSSV